MANEAAADVPAISDHGLLRFLERGGGLDVEALREDLRRSLTRAHRAARQLGVYEYVVKADGMLLLMRGGTLVTVLEEKSPYQSARVLDPERCTDQ
ncbi:hypothetical protein D2V17_14320 [Aurantiacibacter xanthus]|uniref:Uncharacterized protein n=1 Tax=Aurantiacibacter xanthus TaxID=1784712 RepID=A0A3A1P1F2_9SPHN|nr:hypothetical protein [Aurantiacibacter xanthus]RIV82973.1 hypothetical protein D2V17_14320 [Aurantiacibacter xanthus]